MISIHHLLQNKNLYIEEMKKRFMEPEVVNQLVTHYDLWRERQNQLESLRQRKNDFSSFVLQLQEDEKQKKILEMRETSKQIKTLEEETKTLKRELDRLVGQIPNLSSAQTPTGKSDTDNQILQVWGTKPEFNFEPKFYWELPVYRKYVGQEEGVKVMGSRGFYMRGDMAKFQKTLFDFALNIILQEGFELFYVPLMLNDKVLTGTGHLPDFEGQQYEVKIDENKYYYLIGSSEPSILGYFMNKDIGDLEKPVLVTCWSSCFRKEAGSYGRDQQGILRVHQFEKIEMIALCKPEQAQHLFERLGLINEKIYTSLGLHFRSVEICTGDMPSKHYRQIDYEAWFPKANKFREISSNGNATDFQNRGLGIRFSDDKAETNIPYGLNCTGVVFRAGLAILEQFQQANGSVKLPEVLTKCMGKEYLE